VSADAGRNRLIATVDLGRCALLPASLGGEHDDLVTAELRARKDELVKAGVLKYEATPPRAIPPHPMIPTPAEVANDIF
jgi:hypothetical protein